MSWPVLVLIYNMPAQPRQLRGKIIPDSISSPLREKKYYVTELREIYTLQRD